MASRLRPLALVSGLRAGSCRLWFGVRRPRRRRRRRRRRWLGFWLPAPAWARTPGPGVLAAPVAAIGAYCNRGRHTCGRSARPRTATPAGSRVVRSGPCRYRCASGRSPDRCVRPRTIRDAWARGAGSPAGGGGHAAGTAAWACRRCRLGRRPAGRVLARGHLREQERVGWDRSVRRAARTGGAAAGRCRCRNASLSRSRSCSEASSSRTMRLSVATSSGNCSAAVGGRPQQRGPRGSCLL